MTRIFATATLIALSAVATASPELELQVERAVVFKDGHALFIRKGHAIADEQGRVYTHAVPERAVLGCIWAMAEEKPAALYAEEVPSESSTTTTRPARSVAELLIANKGVRVELLYHDRELRPVRGTVRDVLRIGDSPAMPMGDYLSSIAPPTWPVQDGLLQLEMDGGQTAMIPINRIAEVRGSGIKTTFDETIPGPAVRKRLSIQFAPESAGTEVEVTLLHIAPGLQWTPTYRMTGTLKDSSTLSLMGELNNGAEDLKDTQVDLVVGVPNLRFHDRLSPLTLEKTLQQAVRASSRDLSQQMLSNAMYSQVRLGGTMASDDAGAPEEGAIGEQVADLFVYPIGAVTLKKGARAAMPIWQREVAMRDVYTVAFASRAASQRDANNYGYNDNNPSGSPSVIEEHQVWHQFELENQTGMPWTSGPLLFLRDQMPIGQDLLTYTPVRGKTLVPVTKAVNVRADLVERETSRDPRGLEIDGTWYSTVEKSATITVENFHDETITFRVTLEAEGRISGESDDATVSTSDRATAAFGRMQWPWLNPFSSARWDLTLAPGEKKTISCAVQYYAR